LEEVKADRLKLRNQNKQNLQHIENLERTLQTLQYKISELEKQQKIDKEFFEDFQKVHINSGSKKCQYCCSKSFSNCRAEAEQEPLRSGWVDFKTIK
jgi:hypothetical protein